VITLGFVLALIGSSYRQAPLPLIAGLAESDALRLQLDRLLGGDDPILRGIVTLATCNRFEMYVETPRPDEAIEALRATAAAALGTIANPPLTVRTGPAAAHHLFRVAAGLDSMVVGEAEISGQVATAFRSAQQAATTTSTLNLLFQAAARTAKRVATDTELGAAGRSIAVIALDAAQRRIGPVEHASVLLIGTGSYGRVIAAALKSRHCHEALVFSPSGRHLAFAADRGMTAVDAIALGDTLSRVDLVVTASGTGATVLAPKLISEVLSHRDKPLTVIDLAVRGDIPAETRALPGIDVIDLAALVGQPSDIADATIARAEQLVSDAVDDFVAHTAERRLDPAVVALRHHVTDTIDREMNRLLPKLPVDSAHDVERSLHRIARSLLHTPTVQAHALARDGQSAQYVDALRTLFGIEAPLTDTGAGHQ
jgi:glutamyl-tRNA reductase